MKTGERFGSSITDLACGLESAFIDSGLVCAVYVCLLLRWLLRKFPQIKFAYYDIACKVQYVYVVGARTGCGLSSWSSRGVAAHPTPEEEGPGDFGESHVIGRAVACIRTHLEVSFGPIMWLSCCR